MISASIIANVISLLAGSPAITFSSFLETLPEHDVLTIEQNQINDWDDLSDYLIATSNSISSPNPDGISKKISNPLDFLNTYYPTYEWIMDVDNCAYTSDVTNAIPKEMQSNDCYTEEEINEAILQSHVENWTNYGGCGPIAAMGILDYFSRYLGYKEFIENPDDSLQRIALAKEILSKTTFSAFSKLNLNETLVWPTDYVSLMAQMTFPRGLSDKINLIIYETLTGNKKNVIWNNITISIANGIPLTLITGPIDGKQEFSGHYTNVYGYETWIGVSRIDSSRINKQFIKARLNWGQTDDAYCDADILNSPLIASVSYEFHYSQTTTFAASDFSSLVNNNGNGQYFFDNVFKQITLSSGINIDTYRLRTSYIENQHLVLSPNRSGAGTAFLELGFYHPVQQLSFSASLWSGLEGILDQTFIIQYEDTNFQYVDHISINLNKLSTSKTYKDNFLVLFPKETSLIRFYAYHNSPSGNRNKGRIVLDNFIVKYNGNALI